MVSIFDAYRILNKSVLDVINDVVSLNVAEVEDKVLPHRMEDVSFSVTDKHDRVKPIIVAHNLSQYVNRFYSIKMESSEICYLNILIMLDSSEVDLSEFVEGV